MNSFPLPAVLVCLVLLVGGPVAAADPESLAVDISNESEPALCAETDNVGLAFASADVKGFRIEAGHPLYLSTGLRDRQAPDGTSCDMTKDPVYRGEAPPQKAELYREAGLWIVAHRFATFWRPASALVHVGKRTEKGLHMLQVWSRRPGESRAEEILVLYPQDGYWRARPFTPPGMQPTAYGSSFLVGPVEVAGRPVVSLTDVRFEPKTRSFTLRFAGGGTGSLRLLSVDQERIVLEAAFGQAIGPGPFAMLRSMYVTEFNNDVARIAVREPGAPGWRESGIMSFQRARASEVWAGRLTVSRHNTSSPDHVFSRFSNAAPAVAK